MLGMASTTPAQVAVAGVGQTTGAVVQRVARNFKGRDFAVGDIHGCFDGLCCISRPEVELPQTPDAVMPLPPFRACLIQ